MTILYLSMDLLKTANTAPWNKLLAIILLSSSMPLAAAQPPMQKFDEGGGSNGGLGERQQVAEPATPDPVDCANEPKRQAGESGTIFASRQAAWDRQCKET